MTFLVELSYREPSYEARTGVHREPYRFRYRIEAPSEEAAVSHALREFREISALSGVGWGRDVVGCEVSRTPMP
jgi:hypothetical protein